MATTQTYTMKIAQNAISVYKSSIVEGMEALALDLSCFHVRIAFDVATPRLLISATPACITFLDGAGGGASPSVDALL